MMKRLLLASTLIAGLAAPGEAPAQQARVVTACGSVAPFGAVAAGNPLVLSVDPNGNLCVTGSSGGGGASALPVGAASGATGQVSVTTATAPATTIAAARTGASGTGRVSITIINNTGTDKVCLGFSNAVTPTTGQCLPAIAGAAHTFNTTSAIYGVVPTTTQTVSYAETF